MRAYERHPRPALAACACGVTGYGGVRSTEERLVVVRTQEYHPCVRNNKYVLGAQVIMLNQGTYIHKMIPTSDPRQYAYLYINIIYIQVYS